MGPLPIQTLISRPPRALITPSYIPSLGREGFGIEPWRGTLQLVAAPYHVCAFQPDFQHPLHPQAPEWSLCPALTLSVL